MAIIIRLGHRNRLVTGDRGRGQLERCGTCGVWWPRGVGCRHLEVRDPILRGPAK